MESFWGVGDDSDWLEVMSVEILQPQAEPLAGSSQQQGSVTSLPSRPGVSLLATGRETRDAMAKYNLREDSRFRDLSEADQSWFLAVQEGLRDHWSSNLNWEHRPGDESFAKRRDEAKTTEIFKRAVLYNVGNAMNQLLIDTQAKDTKIPLSSLTVSVFGGYSKIRNRWCATYDWKATSTDGDVKSRSDDFVYKNVLLPGNRDLAGGDPTRDVLYAPKKGYQGWAIIMHGQSDDHSALARGVGEIGGAFIEPSRLEDTSQGKGYITPLINEESEMSQQ